MTKDELKEAITEVVFRAMNSAYSKASVWEASAEINVMRDAIVASVMEDLEIAARVKRWAAWKAERWQLDDPRCDHLSDKSEIAGLFLRGEEPPT